MIYAKSEMQRLTPSGTMLAALIIGIALVGIYFTKRLDTSIPVNNNVTVISVMPQVTRLKPIKPATFVNNYKAEDSKKLFTDDILDGLIDNSGVGSAFSRDISQLYTKLRSEARDTEWADNTEVALKGKLLDVPYLEIPPRVTCGSTICEIAGSISNNISIPNLNLVTGKIQDIQLIPTEQAYSLDNRLISFKIGTSENRINSSAFVRYVFRKNSGYAKY